MTEARIQQVVTAGAIGVGNPNLPAEGVTLENNVWIVGDDAQALIIDAAHDSGAIIDAVGDRDTLGILLTHGHEDHINAALETAKQLDTHVYLHPADLFLWEGVHGDATPDFELTDGATFSVAGVELVTAHTPGHTPGSVSFVASALGSVFSGDTLFQGGPGATRWDYSDFAQIIESIQGRLLTLPGESAVLPGHGEGTRIDVEATQVEEWIARGW